MIKHKESFYSHPPSMEEVTMQVPCFEFNMENGRKKLSVVVPLYNEEENVRKVVEDLEETLSFLNGGCEIILVDDGSTDGTADIAHVMEGRYPNIRVLSHGINRGKSAALMTGFSQVEGDYIVLMDGDGQFLAKDILRMMEKLEEGYDVVNGWGKKRESLAKIIPSLLYNGICRKLFSLNVRQFNLGFKAFKRKAVENLYLKKDEHRYMLPLLKERGCTITEVPVEYLPRQNGTSKYGIMRIPMGIMDMVSLKTELSLGERPFRFFGLASIGLTFTAVVLGLYTVYQWIQGNGLLLWAAVLSSILFLSGINMFFIGYAVEAVKHPRR